MNGDNVPPHLILLGHLAITVPAILILPLVVYWGFGEFGPSLWPYYLTAGLALGWQWYSIALPRWESLLTRRGFQVNQPEKIARQSGFIWPGAGWIGSFALHTTAVTFCGIFFGPWLLSRWFVWIMPLIRISSATARGDYWLQHLELVSIIPALILGAVVARHFEKLASWAWVVPTIILVYKLSTFTEPHASVLASADPWSRFSYYFVIQQHMPAFSNLGLTGSDPVRVAEQLDVTVPFYSGIAYSVGALLTKYKAIGQVTDSLRREHEAEPFLATKGAEVDPAHEGK